MTFREMLGKYKEGTLEEEQKALLEREIEKYEAISDYLLEMGDIPELEEVFGEPETFGTDQDASKTDADVQFVALVNRSIRRAFRRLAAGVLALTLVIVLFLQFCLPQVISAFYYDPAKEIADGQNQMSLDLAVYSELFWPCRQRSQVNAEEKGYGKYDISIPQTISYNRNFTNVSGEIIRGRLKLYDSNVLNAPTGNCFAWFQAIGDLSRPLTEIWEDEESEEGGDATESTNVCAAGTRQQARETLESLSDTEKYIGYVSLNRMMEYEPFMEFLDGQTEIGNAWCAVKTNDPVRLLDEEDNVTEEIFRADNIGFVCDPDHSSSLTWDEETYPGLILWNESPEEVEITDKERKDQWDETDRQLHTEEYMRQHFVSLLTYMADQEQFLSMMEAGEGRSEQLTAAADYVRENGITVYGFAAVMDKETALRLEELDEVYEIYIEDLR